MSVDRDAGSDPRPWIGRSETHEDLVGAFPAAALDATFDRAQSATKSADALGPLRHWLYFLPLDRQEDLGRDGHPERGGFLPPIALPRRMWAGGRLDFHAPLRIGARVRRVSTIVDVTEKRGRSGHLAFVTVRHEIFQNERALITEEHDIVYRASAALKTSAQRPQSKRVPKAAREPTFARTVTADERLLFRYSALTFNAHRIHYDRRYVTQEEGYPGLVVHGPLLATLLADFAVDHSSGASLATFSFRAMSPIFDGAPFRLCGNASDDGTMTMWIVAQDGAVAMDARATFTPISE